ncbi:hypothetical protein ONZ45_g9390 [Pleurotus djamor]|nr:hypothetical protein ONZ45_g9390 [Pleurotus djamor]
MAHQSKIAMIWNHTVFNIHHRVGRFYHRTSSEKASLPIQHKNCPYYRQVPIYQADFKSSHPSTISLPPGGHSLPLVVNQARPPIDHSSYFPSPSPSPYSGHPTPLSGEICSIPTQLEAFDYFTSNQVFTDTTLWNPAMPAALPNIQHPPLLSNSLPSTQEAEMYESFCLPLDYPELLGVSPHQFPEWMPCFPNPPLEQQTHSNPITRSNSESSLSTLSDEAPSVPSVYLTPPSPDDPTHTTPKQSPSPAPSAPSFNYDAAVRDFKSTKRQRRIPIKSHTTASSGASIKLSPDASEFTPIFSEKDQLWYCNVCGKGIKRHGDVIRHWRSYNCPVRKAACAGTKKRLACPYPSCKYSTGRRDGLSRHLNVHKPVDE